MEKCPKCKSENIKTNTGFNFFDVFTCQDCEYWTYQLIKDCCREPQSRVKLKQLDNGQRFLYYQCDNCGGKMKHPPLSFKKYEHKISGNWNQYATEERYIKLRKENSFLKTEKCSYNALDSRYSKYLSYLSSSKWKTKRQLALERDNFQCQKCTEKPAYDVHHLTYENLGNEKLEELLSVCRKCHIQIHEE